VLFDLPNLWVSKLKEKTSPKSVEVIIGIGSNIDPETNLLSALMSLGELTDLVQISGIWQTPAFGSDGPDYLNSAAIINTTLPQEEFKIAILHKIEKKLGRTRTNNKYSDRTIDLDILIYNGEILDEDLWTQAFVAVPVAKLAPNVKNPATGETISQAAERLRPGIDIIKREDLF